LARAVYANLEILLLDDPVSALDSQVKQDIFHEVFQGMLQGKTRVLVTHAIDYVHLVDRVILIEDGNIVVDGHYNEINDNPHLVKLI
jgi:ATP-binding cassette subfamily C (CFTR/MRP) protein 5